MTKTEEILSRIFQGFSNSKELFLKHPLLAWQLLSHNTETRRHLFFIVSGGNVGIHTTEDGWKDLGSHIRNKIWHHSTK